MLYQSLNVFYLFFIALWNAFNFLENDVKRKNAKLCKLLDAPLLVKEFTKAIEKLSLPSIRTKTFLANCLLHEKNPEKLKEIWQDFQRTNLDPATSLMSPSEKQFFKKNYNLKSKLEEFVKTCLNLSITTKNKKIQHNEILNSFMKDEKMKNSVLLSDLSPNLLTLMTKTSYKEMIGRFYI